MRMPLAQAATGGVLCRWRWKTCVIGKPLSEMGVCNGRGPGRSTRQVSAAADLLICLFASVPNQSCAHVFLVQDGVIEHDIAIGIGFHLILGLIRGNRFSGSRF